MKTRKLLTSGIAGIFIGLFLTMFVSYQTTSLYLPLRPLSPIGQLFAKFHVHPSITLLYCMLIWFLLGILFGLGAFIFRKDWSILRMTVTHYLLMLSGFAVLANLAGFFPETELPSLLLNILIGFSLVYIIVYLLLFIITQRKIRQINQQIQGKKG